MYNVTYIVIQNHTIFNMYSTKQLNKSMHAYKKVTKVMNVAYISLLQVVYLYVKHIMYYPV